MKTTVFETKLSDGSSVFSVCFSDVKNTKMVYIDCIDENSAYRLQNSFELNAIDGYTK